jgi:PAS domain S-box-containing protein
MPAFTTNSSDKYYQQIVKFANVAILRFDKEFRLTEFTGNSSKIFGFTRDEVLGKSLYETIVPRFESTGRDLKVLINDILSSTETYEYNINQNITKNGDRIWMQWYNSEIRDDNNDFMEILSIGIDITDRVNAEMAMKESEERFRTLSNLTFEGIIIHDEGIILDCNFSFESQIGYSRDELLGMQLFDHIISSAYRKSAVELVMNQSMQYEAEAIHKNGTIIPISIESRSIMLGNKMVRVAAIRNISELKKTIRELDQYKNRLEELVKVRTKELKQQSTVLKERNEELKITLEELKEAQSHLVQSEKMASLGVLLAGIAHEINNPVNFIYAGVNSLIKDFHDVNQVLEYLKNVNHDNLDMQACMARLNNLKQENEFDTACEAIGETIQDIRLGAIRIKEIIDSLSKFSRLDTEKWKVIDLHDEINDVLVLLKNKYKHNIEIRKDFDESLPLVECYPGKLNQVFMNIISNAIDAIGQEHGVITIQTGHDSEKVAVSIRDTGKGIKEELRKKIFDPFFTTKDVGFGLGLGLSICYSIIQEHKGEIRLESEENKGTEFTIRIPIQQTDRTQSNLTEL